MHRLDRDRIGRLSVVEGQKLVGIITRADIIRVEAERVSSTVSPLKVRARPLSTYQSPHVGLAMQ